VTCSSCGSTRVYASRLRSSIERLRESITGRQPHRCHQCGRRWWATAEILPRGDGSPTRPDDLRTGTDATPVKPAELDDLDPIRSKR
jgi:hypothetical protein